QLSLPAAALPGIVLVTSLMTILPLTINGLGFREAATVWCLAAYGIGRDEALAFGLLVLAVTLASSVVGGIVYVVWPPAERGRPNG
ncbi:MAG: lysylphosphatidylglycerol synthase domain-containing protein, partial [Actinomycetota bacterium]